MAKFKMEVFILPILILIVVATFAASLLMPLLVLGILVWVALK